MTPASASCYQPCISIIKKSKACQSQTDRRTFWIIEMLDYQKNYCSYREKYEERAFNGREMRLQLMSNQEEQFFL